MRQVRRILRRLLEVLIGHIEVVFAGDYYLMLETGRWDPISETWTVDPVTSPCIDAGAPESPAGDEPLPNGGRINMGVCGGTRQASLSASGNCEYSLDARRLIRTPQAGCMTVVAATHVATMHGPEAVIPASSRNPGTIGPGPSQTVDSSLLGAAFGRNPSAGYA
ncbi:MAG: hypothetical protein KBE65_02095 [Phycisphaerae bacterium]|nr:hypothetical protein [Phycisphaerae bacterium]